MNVLCFCPSTLIKYTLCHAHYLVASITCVGIYFSAFALKELLESGRIKEVHTKRQTLSNTSKLFCQFVFTSAKKGQLRNVKTDNGSSARLDDTRDQKTTVPSRGTSQATTRVLPCMFTSFQSLGSHCLREKML